MDKVYKQDLANDSANSGGSLYAAQMAVVNQNFDEDLLACQLNNQINGQQFNSQSYETTIIYTQ